MWDEYIPGLLEKWRDKATDATNIAFINTYLSQLQEMNVDPKSINEARKLARRIADRLYNFQFLVNGKKYNASEAAEIVAAGDDQMLARELYRLQNDSAALLAADATKLYFMYSQMGQHKGYRSSLDYNLSKLSFRKPEWLKIADELRELTQDEYDTCLKSFSEETGITRPRLFEIEQYLYKKAIISDDYFTSEKCEQALSKLLQGLGLTKLRDGLIIQTIDSGGIPAVSLRLCPPHDNIMVISGGQGFDYYRRMAAELGRAMPWVYADTTLPYMLRDYPDGSEEMLTIFFERVALNRKLMSDSFGIPENELDRFHKYYGWLTIFRLRQILINFYFDYSLSEEISPDAPTLYASQEEKLFGIEDNSFQWIEILITGGLESYPKKLAHIFAAIKLEAMLTRQFGEDYSNNPEIGRFLVNRFCRSGKAQTLEQFITANSKDRLSVKEFKGQLQLQ
jgi:hypothetical protein